MGLVTQIYKKITSFFGTYSGAFTLHIYGASKIHITGIYILVQLSVCLNGELKLVLVITDSEKSNDSLFPILDNPIKKLAADCFGWSNEVSDFVGIIARVDVSKKAYSVGVEGEWGSGKTSFVSLCLDQLDDREYIKIEFNPRHSGSLSDIRKDFFSLLKINLSKYDSSFSRLIPHYTKAIINESGFASYLKYITFLWSDGDIDQLRNKIEKRLAKIGRKVVIVVDDFDRLTKSEIIEVLKLIDGIANFKNTIFLTAFDKGQMNSRFKTDSETRSQSFVDKYFSYEFPVPAVRYSSLVDYAERLLSLHKGELTKVEKGALVSILRTEESVFEPLISNIRDLIRFLNNTVIPYSNLIYNVEVFDYLCIKAIKLKQPEVYNKIKEKEFVSLANDRYTVIRNKNLLYEDYKLPDHIINLIKRMFPEAKENTGERFNCINRKNRFDIYFWENTFDRLECRCLVNYLTTEHRIDDDIPNEIISFYQNKEQCNDFVAYLLDTKERFSDYFEGYRNLIVLLFKLLEISRDDRLFNLLVNMSYASNLDAAYKATNYLRSLENTYLLLLKSSELQDDIIGEVVGNIHKHKANKTFNIIQSARLKSLTISRLLYCMKRKSRFTVQQIFRCYIHCNDGLDSSRRYKLNPYASGELCADIKRNPEFYFGYFIQCNSEISYEKPVYYISVNVYFIRAFESTDSFDEYINSEQFSLYSQCSKIRGLWEYYKSHNYQRVEFDQDRQPEFENTMKEIGLGK